MRNLTPSFTMRRDGVLPRGDWFAFKDKATTKPKIYIYDEIGFWGTSASEFVSELNDLDADSLELHLNSPGGEIFDGLAIYNALKQNKANVTVYVDGLAASAASFIAQAGDEVIMARNAQMMIHDGIAFAYGNEQDMLDTAKILSDLSNNIADIYAYRAGKRGFSTTLDEFRALMREEVWYNGKEAVEAGLADVVLDQDDNEAEEAKNKWDLGSIYNHAGREKAESPLRIQEKIRLSNRQKGNEMSQSPKATVDPEATPAPVPDGTPPAEPAQPTGDPEETGTEAQPQEDPQTATEPATATQPENKAAGQQGVMINGRLETDWNIIRNHVASLTAAQDEQRAVNRREFVENLAKENKIAAPMIDKLVELVNGTDTVPGMSDEQFAAFQASYESAPASSVLAQYDATQPGQSTGQPSFGGQMTADQKKDRISVLEGTLAMHRRGGMSEENVKKTKSYIELQSLLGSDDA